MALTYTYTTGGKELFTLTTKGVRPTSYTFAREVYLGTMLLGTIHTTHMGIHKGRIYGRYHSFHPTAAHPGGPTTGSTVKEVLYRVGMAITHHKYGV